MAIPQLVTGLSMYAAKKFTTKVLDKKIDDVVSGKIDKRSKEAGNYAGVLSDMSANSLIEFAGVARVEPITAIDSTLVPYDFTTDVLKMLNSIYAGFYLSAGALATDVGRVKTTQLLDKLNPSRSLSFNVANSILLNAAVGNLNVSKEGIKEDLTGIPSKANRSENVATDEECEVEYVEAAVNPVATTLPVYSSEDDKAPAFSGISGAKQAADLTTVANLSVGQTITLTVSDNGDRREIPITIRLISYPTQPRILARILNWSERDNRLSTRLSSWRAGELSFWRDVVLMRDIFAEQKKALMQDKTGLLQALTTRSTKNMAAGLASMTPSLGTVSSILVISEDTARLAEQEMFGKLSDFRTRQRIMNATGIMLIAVVNPVDEFVTLYSYSIALPSEFSIKQIKAGTKGSGPDISELVKLIQAGTPPSF